VALACLLFLPQYREISTNEDQLTQAIKEKSWNSAGTWWVIENQRDYFVVEYRLPIFKFTRYKLSKALFDLDGAFNSLPQQLDFDGCQVKLKASGGCIKFRNLSPEK
jgi:hypothetical protein